MCVCVIIGAFPLQYRFHRDTNRDKKGATLGSEGEHLHMTPLGEKLFVIDLKVSSAFRFENNLDNL